MHERRLAKEKRQRCSSGAISQIAHSLSVCHGCLLYGARVVIPNKLRRQVLNILHEWHFGIQRMKQLARTAVYWLNIDSDILDLFRQCPTCAKHHPELSKAAVLTWMLPEKPRSRLHIDHAINFLGYNRLVLTDAYTKYPCIHATQAVSAKSTTKLLQEDFGHLELTALLPSTLKSSTNSVRRMELLI